MLGWIPMSSGPKTPVEQQLFEAIIDQQNQRDGGTSKLRWLYTTLVSKVGVEVQFVKVSTGGPSGHEEHVIEPLQAYYAEKHELLGPEMHELVNGATKYFRILNLYELKTCIGH